LGILVTTLVGGTGASKIKVTNTRIVGNPTGGILLAGKVEATIEANQILRNSRYGVFVDEVFTGYITGRGNTIAWNELADMCPQELAFLTTKGAARGGRQ
jgi:hypothetical protein